MPSRPSRPLARARRSGATSADASTLPSHTNQAMVVALHTGRSAAARAGSDVEAELHRVPVDGVVVLALDPDLPGLLGLRPRSQFEQQVPVDHLGLDESALEV